MQLGPGSHSVSQPPWQLGDVMWFCSASCGRKGWIQFLPTSWMGQQLTFCSPLSSFLWQRAEETQTAGVGRLSQLPSEEEPRIEQQGKENLGPCCPQRAESPSTGTALPAETIADGIEPAMFGPQCLGVSLLQLPNLHPLLH